MSDTNKTCPKCSAAMQRGHLPDYTDGGVVAQEQWTPGDPEKLRFLGIGMGIRGKPKESIAVTAFRCVKCGFLELYASG